MQAFTGQRNALCARHPDTMPPAADLAPAGISHENSPRASRSCEKPSSSTARSSRMDSKHSGASLAGQKKYSEAEPLLIEGYQGMAARKGVPGFRDAGEVSSAWP